MTLDEAIKHCEKKADELNKEVLNQANLCNAREMAECQECARDHEQLAEWLKELKAYKDMPKGELISRQALKKRLKAKIDLDQDAEFDRGYYIAIKACIGEIDNAPAVEAYTKEDMKKEYKRGITDAYRDNPPI
jgi:hypothetical protein